MEYKYIKLILFLSVSIQAAPKVFNSLGSELESFQQKDCMTYQMEASIPKKIKDECSIFDTKLNNAFKAGYELDPYIDSGINEKKLNKYLSLLRNLDKRKGGILTMIYSEAKKARIQNNTKVYSQLIKNNNVKLYSRDYEFMEKHKDVFSNNERYLSYVQYMKDLREQRKNHSKEKDGNTHVYQKTKNMTGHRKTKRMTVPQKNAVRSAKQYLDFSGFSRDGLIRQLSSSAGSGYKVTDATIAVDSLNIDWNMQAVRSTKQYLDFSGFSCKGLIRQLSSSAGSKYTIEQATYGARQEGVCK